MAEFFGKVAIVTGGALGIGRAAARKVLTEGASVVICSDREDQVEEAVAELREEGLEGWPVPSNFPQRKEHTDVSYEYINFSDGEAASEGSWAKGPTPDGHGEFSYRAEPEPGVPMPPATQPDARWYGTTPKPNTMEKIAGEVQDKLHME